MVKIMLDTARISFKSLFSMPLIMLLANSVLSEPSLLTCRTIPKMTTTQVLSICLRNFNFHLKKSLIKILYFQCKNLLENSCAYFSLSENTSTKNTVATIKFCFLIGRGEKRPKIPRVVRSSHSDLNC